ncbi:MAG: transporter substrate-binding protein [Naasia sp.]|uniref:ABC transporter substrate-binding protein n=1 Tax=Naasia sp. TaxID=2546198 RepID=UPI002622838F|nr:ABC transporter substrate-binding protein [Naasia sp.]MCU1570878.1 transporter substrate-binding protein [Naasia sp.]
MTSAPPRARRIALIAAVALIPLLAGCSAGGSASGSASGSAAVVSPPAISKEGTLKVCASNEPSAPNMMFDDSGELIGSEIDLADAVGAELGLEVEFVQSAFAGLIPGLQAKQCDTIISTLYIKPEREEIVDFVPYLRSGTAIAAEAGNPAGLTGMDDSLCGKRMMVAVGTTAEELTKEQSGKCEDAGKESIDVSTSGQATVGLQQLAAGQLDGYVDTAEVIGYYIEQTDASIEMAGEPFDTINIGAATLKDNSALHDALQTAFDSVMESGKYDDILAEWGQQDIAYTP